MSKITEKARELLNRTTPGRWHYGHHPVRYPHAVLSSIYSIYKPERRTTYHIPSYDINFVLKLKNGLLDSLILENESLEQELKELKEGK